MLLRLDGGQRTCVNADVCDLILLSASVCVHRHWCLTAMLLEVGQSLGAKHIHISGILIYLNGELNPLMFHSSTKCTFTIVKLD